MNEEAMKALEGINAYASHDGLHVTVSFKGHEAKQYAMRVSAQLGYTMPKTNCISCAVQLVNTLRKAAGLEPLVKSVSHFMLGLRLKQCLGSPEEGIERCPKLSTESGALGRFPFFQMRDATCTACGCNIYVKADLKGYDCPLGKWPQHPN